LHQCEDEALGQVTVFSGAERRRRWSEAEKIDLVSRAFAPDAIVSQVARSADVHPSQLYRWRAELGSELRAGEPGFARVVVGSEEARVGDVIAIRVRLGAAQVDIAGHAPGALVAATLKALVG
jgi:transposase